MRNQVANEVKTAIEQWLDFGEEMAAKGMQGGYFSRGGWAYDTLNAHLERLLLAGGDMRGTHADLRFVRQFVGWLTADLPELHTVEVPRLEESLQRFLAVVGCDTAPECEACRDSGVVPVWDSDRRKDWHQQTCPVCSAGAVPRGM